MFLVPNQHLLAFSLSSFKQAARQGHEDVVDILVKTGAILGGSDVEGGFVPLIVNKAVHAHDERAIRIWKKAGAGILAGTDNL